MKLYAPNTDRGGYPRECAQCHQPVTLKQRATLAAVVHKDGSETRSTFHMSCLEAAKAACEEARADV